MGIDYQLKTTGNTLPKAVHMQVNWILKDYYRMRRERENILFSSSYDDGQPKSKSKGDATANKAVRLAALSERVDGIDKAIHDVNAHYADKIKRGDVDYFDSLEAFNDYGGFCYMLYNPETGEQPSLRTWKYFRQTLAYKIAENLKIL